MRRVSVAVTLIVALLVVAETGEAKDMDGAAFKVDYPSYLARHEIVYLSPPMEGYEGFPLGNGDLGAMIWCTDSGLQVQINKSDTWDQPNEESGMLLRSCARVTLDTGTPALDWLYLDDFQGRLSLYRAEAAFSSSTPFLRLSSVARIQANRNVLALGCEVEGRGDLAKQGTAIRVGLERWGSRAFGWWYSGIRRPASPGLGQAGAVVRGRDVCIRERFQGLDFVVACRVLGGDAAALVANPHRVELTLPATPAQKFTVLVGVVTSDESPDPLSAAIRLLDEWEREGAAKLQAEHEAWWSNYWSRSFVHIGDDYLENLYYLHQYLMGSGSRGRYPLMFNAGLWTWNRDVRNWELPHHWNMQQAYWSVCAANHPELMKPYLETYWRLKPHAEEYAKSRGFEGAILWNEKHDYAGRMVSATGTSFVNDFTPASQIGQAFWRYYRYTGDRAFLKECAYPFMKEAAEFYLKYLKRDEAKQQYYIFPASPYECEVGNQYTNTITDLAAIRGSFRACIEASRILDADAPKRDEWQCVLDRLAPYPLTNIEGKGEAFAVAIEEPDKKLPPAGAFCAALAPVFPAGVLGLADRGSPLFEAAVRRAEAHPPNMLAISPIAVADARLGLGDGAFANLLMSVRQLQHFPQGFFYNIDHWHSLSRYADKVPDGVVAGQRDYIYDRATRYKGVRARGEEMPDERIDTPTQPFVQCGLEPSGILATAINEMLLQSYDGTIRIFPAIPKEWPASFTLRAEGGFLVSSRKDADKAPPRVVITSLLGNECRLVWPWPGKPTIEVVAPLRQRIPHTQENDVVRFATVKDAVYEIRPERAPAQYDETIYSGQINQKPKTYREAVLGKPRDF